MASLTSKVVTEVLAQHVHKEDNVLFPMAYRVLSEERLEEVDRLAEADASSRPTTGIR